MSRILLALITSVVVLTSVPGFAETAGEPAKPAATKVQEFDKQMAQVQENMKKMQEQMELLGQAKDPQARQKLLEEHWATMQNTMQSMAAMWGPNGCMGGSGAGAGAGAMGNRMMGGAMMGWSNAGSYYEKLTPEQQKQWQYMMDRFMPMQQMMMNHMMWHNQWMWQQQPSSK